MFAFTTDRSYAQQADAADILAGFKKEFHFPKKNDQDVIYFCGNSLGLQPRLVQSAIETELTTWRGLAVGGYF
ncbi:MAG: kynureninase, partial [Chitinophagaceae bacterium]|nr:kynureninase [Chitinophagaceae bacterium]